MITIEGKHTKRNLQALLRFLCTSVPWQYCYKRTFGKPKKTVGSTCWSILKLHDASFDPLTFKPEKMTFVRSTDQSTRADPFHCVYQQNSYLFLEEWPSHTPSGHLSVMEFDRTGFPAEPPVSVIRNNTHFSYPFTFEYAGELWMLPENSSSGNLQIYRCLEFPLKWVPDKILMTGIRYADPTLFEKDGRWWLFLTLAIGFHGVNTGLFLFSADSPLSDDWTPHPLNPIVTGFHHSRPAGRIFTLNGKIYRPSQDCLKRYGHGLRLNEILHLDSDQYEEKCVRKFFPWDEKILGIHHIELSNGQIFMDVLTIQESK